MKIAVIGAGFSGLASAGLLARNGHEVTLLEKNAELGGRAWSQEKQGYKFDMGPSWYMMPEVHEDFFSHFGKQSSDFFKLKKLSPSYQIITNSGSFKIFGDIEKDAATFESFEPGSGEKLRKLLEDTKEIYDISMSEILYGDQAAFSSVLKPGLVSKILKGGYHRSYESVVRRYFSSPELIQATTFMSVFLGGSPRSLPGIYSLLCYADMGKGIWYPMGGMNQLVRAYVEICRQHGVKIVTKFEVKKIAKNQSGYVLKSADKEMQFDKIVIAGEYSHFDRHVLTDELKVYNEKFWRKKMLSPSGQIMLIGLNKRLKNLEHHNLFFDADWNDHFAKIDSGDIATKPLFYLCNPSKTDSAVAPKGKENLFILIPQSNKAKNYPAIAKAVKTNVLERISKFEGTDISKNVEYEQTESSKYFEQRFFADKGNAFGLAHTLRQSSFLRPPIRHPRADGIYFAGQFTNPGTGVPLAVISGQVAAEALMKDSK